MIEVWKPVNGYDGIYEVSNLGRIKSIRKTEKILKVTIGSNGYPKIGFYYNKIYKTHSVHRLVAETFLPNPNNLLFVDHIDRNPTNNKITNLRWVTREENLKNRSFSEHYSMTFFPDTFTWVVTGTNKNKISFKNSSEAYSYLLKLVQD